MRWYPARVNGPDTRLQAVCLGSALRGQPGARPSGTRRKPIHGGSTRASMHAKVPKGLAPGCPLAELPVASRDARATWVERSVACRGRITDDSGENAEGWRSFAKCRAEMTLGRRSCPHQAPFKTLARMDASAKPPWMGSRRVLKGAWWGQLRLQAAVPIWPPFPQRV